MTRDQMRTFLENVADAAHQHPSGGPPFLEALVWKFPDLIGLMVRGDTAAVVTIVEKVAAIYAGFLRDQSIFVSGRRRQAVDGPLSIVDVRNWGAVERVLQERLSVEELLKLQ